MSPFDRAYTTYYWTLIETMFYRLRVSTLGGVENSWRSTNFPPASADLRCRLLAIYETCTQWHFSTGDCQYNSSSMHSALTAFDFDNLPAYVSSALSTHSITSVRQPQPAGIAYTVIGVWQTCCQLLYTVCWEQLVTAIHPISQQFQVI